MKKCGSLTCLAPHIGLLIKSWRRHCLPAKTVYLRQYDEHSYAYSRRDGGSRPTDDFNRSKYGITDPPVGQRHLKLASLAITDYQSASFVLACSNLEFSTNILR